MNQNYAQCTITGPFPVNDFDVFDLTMEIEGLQINDMSDPMQGICGVAIEYEHERVGNLLVELTSPSEQVVTLIGPNGPFGLTNFTTWDISFLPCGSAVDPDQNFGPFYTNQNSWGNFGNYTGSYYPFDGCLEDFNSGTANGSWTFTIRDAYQFDMGEIESITLFFCDPTGLECQECAVPEIALLDDSVKICSSNLPSESFEWNIGANYNSVLHNYSFLLSENDTIIAISDTAVISDSTEVGNYMFCGFTYEKMDSAAVFTYLQTGQLLSEALDSIDEAGYCYRGGEECSSVTIEAPQNNIVMDTALCVGDTLIWFTDTITQAGQYMHIDSVNTICPLGYTLNVSPLSLQAQISAIDTLTCTQNNQLIDASPSDYTTNTNIKWLFNNTLIAQDSLQVSVSNAGLYKLILQEMSCADTLSFEVFEDVQPPYLDFGRIDSLNCNLDSIELEADSTTASNTFFIDQSGDTIITDRIWVDRPRSFVFVAVGENGCKKMDSLEVVGDNREVDLQIDSAVNLCGTDTIFLQVFQSDTTHSYLWQGPMGFLADTRDTFAFFEGTYQVTATHAESKCISTDSFDYLFLPPIDSPAIYSDSLSCLQGEVQIQLDSIHPDYVYEWTTPSSDTISVSEPYVQESGIYSLELSRSPNCKIFLQHNVIQSLDLPELQIKGDTLDCTSAAALLVASSIPGDTTFSFEWTGPTGSKYTNDSILVDVPGTYKITLTKDSFCQVIDSFELTEGFNAFPHILSADSLNCRDTVSTIQITGPDSFTYIWMGPNGFVELGQQVSTEDEGVYTVEIETESCVYSRNIPVVADNDAPKWNLNVQHFDCAHDTALIIQNGRKSDSLWVYSEDSMKYFYLENDTFQGLQAGIYELRLKGTNACVTDTTIEIQYDTVPGPYAVEFSGTLNCVVDSVQVVANTNATDIQWVQSGSEIGDEHQVWIDQSSELQLKLQFENACRTDTIIQVPIDTSVAKPQFNLMDLSCSISSYPLQLTFDQALSHIQWTTPDTFFVTTDTFLIVDTIGNYELLTIAENACSFDTSFSVQLDTLIPKPTFLNDTVACTTNTTKIDVNIDTAQLSDFYWRLEEGTISQQLRPELPKGTHTFVFQAKNGCIDSVHKAIYIDTYEAEAGNLPDSLTLNCDSTTYTINPKLPVDATATEWILPDSNSVGSPSIVIDQAGVYRFVMYNQASCGDTTQFHVDIDTVPPSITLFEDTLNCNQPSLTLRHQTTEPKLDFLWQGPDGFQSTQPKPLISKGGIYTLELSDAGGCVRKDSVRIHEDFELPEYSLKDTFYSSCNTGAAQVYITSSAKQISWYYNNRVISNADSFSTNEDGLFRVILKGENGCRAIDSVWVSAKGKLPYAEWIAPVLSCNNLADTIELIQLEGNYDFQWQGPDGFQSNLPSPLVDQEGVYVVTIEDKLGCDSVFTIEIEQISYPISIEFEILEEIRCEDSSAPVIVTLDHELKDTIVNWMALGGSILSGGMSLEAELKGPGRFIVEVEDTVDGCSARDTINIEESETPMLEIRGRVQDQLCENDRGTFIEILPQDSSRAPFKYSIEGTAFEEDNKYLNLLPGDYDIRVKDKQGCIYDTTFSILDKTEENQVYLGEDRDLTVGDIVTIVPEMNILPETIDSFKWAVNGDTICANCDSIEIIIDRSKKVELFVYTTGGCILYDIINLLLPSEQVLFVPNIFSPNNDGTNDIFYIQTQLDISRIEHLQIFDRWGNRVFEARNFPPNDRIYGWDGTFEGKTLFPQVFAVRIVFEHEGERKIEHYDLMLMH